ncbi:MULTISPECIES: SseB family protein [unclassified Microbacterium]|uniref:SseB family protein n=1 Tax=unclassified Microbacterium TaxID=2609290 RepID=UPI0012FCA67E|nr:SseB family protein [Microbacterium sp. MAH-37]MVQ42122.1 SseB family protein [Microbacterium sp. MAH-37]
MALFSRRKKTADPSTVEEAAPVPGVPAEEAAAAEPAEEAVPNVGISVQAFRGVGADAGPEVAAPVDEQAAGPDDEAPVAPSAPLPRREPTINVVETEKPRLPLASAMPPEDTHTIEGLKDNVLLREALAEIAEGASNEELLGVMRQSMQGHLYLRVHGDAGQQIGDGQPLSVAVIREDEKSFLLAFSSGAALRAAVDAEEDPAATSAMAQPVGLIYQQVIDGGFTGIIIDNASAPHRVVFPTELLQQALSQGDPAMAIKGLVSSPRQPDTAARVGEALAKTKVWVAVSDGTTGAPVGIAEAHTADGKRFLQVFSHPLEVVALGRDDRPMPFEPEQLAKVLSSHSELDGVIVDSAGPSLAVERDALGPVLVLAVDLGD